MKLQNRGMVTLKDRVKSLSTEDIEFLLEVQGLLHSFEHKDWGLVDDLQKEQNYNTKGNDDIIIGKYSSSKGIIWIVSNEKVRETVVMFPEDYGEDD